MLYPSAGGTPDMGYPDGSSYIPKRFSKRFIKWFYVTTIFAAICNTYCEGWF